MHGELRGGQLEDQPPAASVHMRLPEDVSEESAVRLGITTEQDDMAAIDHVMRLRGGITCVMEASTVRRLHAARRPRTRGLPPNYSGVVGAIEAAR